MYVWEVELVTQQQVTNTSGFKLTRTAPCPQLSPLLSPIQAQTRMTPVEPVIQKILFSFRL